MSIFKRPADTSIIPQQPQPQPQRSTFEMARNHTDNMIANAQRKESILEEEILAMQTELRETKRVLEAYSLAQQILERPFDQMPNFDLSLNEDTPIEPNADKQAEVAKHFRVQ